MLHKPFPEIDQRTAPEFSDEYLALEFSLRYAHDLRYTAAVGRWSRWDGNIWRADTTLHTFDTVREVCCALAEQCDDYPSAKRITSAQVIAAVERLARSDRRHAATIEQWDSDPWLLSTPDGAVDLKTGELRPARREHYCSKSTAVAPNDELPLLWLEFLARVTDGDTELENFLQKMCGYCLTGVTIEQVFFFLHGPGANGKGVFLNAISNMLGDYARSAPMSSFTASSNEGHPTDLAGLVGARLVSAIETEDGARWAEAKIKSLTGGDRIAARFMKQNFFQYTPQFKLVIAGNHRPGLRSTDEAIRRRLRLIPFNVTIPKGERDKELGEKLKAEYPGILRWAIDGCLAWQAQGFEVPEAVEKATEDYFAEEDTLELWLKERCTIGRQCVARVGDLFEDWRMWCDRAGEHSGSLKAFSSNLVARGFVRERNMRQRLLRGLNLASGRPILRRVWSGRKGR